MKINGNSGIERYYGNTALTRNIMKQILHGRRKDQ